MVQWGIEILVRFYLIWRYLDARTEDQVRLSRAFVVCRYREADAVMGQIQRQMKKIRAGSVAGEPSSGKHKTIVFEKNGE